TPRPGRTAAGEAAAVRAGAAAARVAEHEADARRLGAGGAAAAEHGGRLRVARARFGRGTVRHRPDLGVDRADDRPAGALVRDRAGVLRRVQVRGAAG